MDCVSLRRVVLPDRLGNIGQSAFAGCSSLEEIVIPRATRYIRKRTFKDCRSLRSVRMSDFLGMIEEQAFCGCESLKEINVPDSVFFIGDGAFSECSSLESLGETGVSNWSVSEDAETTDMFKGTKWEDDPPL